MKTRENNKKVSGYSRGVTMFQILGSLFYDKWEKTLATFFCEPIPECTFEHNIQ